MFKWLKKLIGIFTGTSKEGEEDVSKEPKPESKSSFIGGSKLSDWEKEGVIERRSDILEQTIKKIPKENDLKKRTQMIEGVKSVISVHERDLKLLENKGRDVERLKRRQKELKAKLVPFLSS